MSQTSDVLASFLGRSRNFGATGSNLNPIYKSTLLDPISEFLSRTKKGLRFELIQLGHEMANESLGIKENLLTATSSLELFNEVIELLHSGSLIVDDIEDQSKIRRGGKTLHEIYGIPLALNAGNWLYFWPLVLIQESDIPTSMKQRALMECNQTLLYAHTGQALDIGTPLLEIPPHQISELVYKAIELKSGALASLATKLGAMTVYESSFEGNSNIEENLKNYEVIGNFGSQFGQLLQFFDDIGNLISSKNPQKQYEDFKLLRPSFIWAVLAQSKNAKEYHEILNRIVVTKNPLELDQLIYELQLSELSKNEAIRIKDQWYKELMLKAPYLSNELKTKISTLLENLIHAF